MSNKLKNGEVSIKRTGELLLQGWKMLALTCPICNTALLSKDEQLLCPACNLPVVTENSYISTNKKEIESNSSDINLSSQINQFSDLDDARDEYEKRNKNKKLISSKLGERMLSGWTLLGTVCPYTECNGTPLMRLQPEEPMLCVSCDREYLFDRFGTLKESPMLSKSNLTASNYSQTPSIIEDLNQNDDEINFNNSFQSAKSAEFTNNSTFDINDAPVLNLTSFSQSKNDPSSKISEKLLKGWALLDESCSSQNCNYSVPLMKDPKNGKVFLTFIMF